MATYCLVGDWNNPDSLLKLASQVDVVSIENEFVNVDALEQIERSGHSLYPSTACLRRVQDKLTQKQCLKDAGIATTKFVGVATKEQALEAARVSLGSGP